jgi:hypothetical protein
MRTAARFWRERQQAAGAAPRRWLWRSVTVLVLTMACIEVQSVPLAPRRFDGLNVVVASGFPFGSAAAKTSLSRAKRLGARAIAVIPFLWQSRPSSPDLVRGADMSDDELHAAIRDAHALGLAAIVKPQVWVPQSWAGAVAMTSEDDWRRWFANYRRELARLAQIAAKEDADALVIGTELQETTHRPEWSALIAVARSAYSGPLLYAAHNVEEAERVPFWDRLDAIGVTLYPVLGDDDDRNGRRNAMSAIAERLDALSARIGKTVMVTEIGLRSARGAAAKPWESAEERDAAPDPALQAEVIADWLAVLNRPSISGVLIWRWFTDPTAGGTSDTDFTVQGKLAEAILKCAWRSDCDLHAGQAP